MEAKAVRVAILGCGAVAELCHLPSLARLQHPPALLVDRNLPRAQELAQRFGGNAVAGYADCLADFDAAIIALPHHLHANVAVELLAQGKSLLVEKPMALSGDACDAMVSTARASGAVLAVGHVRRFQHGARWLKAALEANLLDVIRSFELRDGGADAWPMASDFLWRKESAGGGVTLDLGAHLFDLLLWWLGEPESWDYRDDDFGGVEAESETTLRLKNYAEGVVELSRTRDLRGTAVLRGSAGTLELDLRAGKLSASPTSLLERTFDGHRGDRLPRQTIDDMFGAQLEDWLAAVAGGRTPAVGGEDGARVIRFIEGLYAKRRRWELPWVKPDPLGREVAR